MRRISLLLAGFLGLAACGDTADGPGPFAAQPDQAGSGGQSGDPDNGQDGGSDSGGGGTPTGGGGGQPSGGGGGPSTPVGTPDLDTSSAVTRREAGSPADDIAYDPASDTFSVDNLPFDGDGVYDRDDQVRALDTDDAGPGAFAVYENNNETERRAYKALYAEGPSGTTRVGIVRTGSYRGFGFGGFVLGRDTGVDLPEGGQATFEGGYAGVRVFDGRTGLEYTDGDARLEVDFDDFDSNDAVEGTIRDREIFDQAGNPIGTLPALVFRTGTITESGEITGSALSDRFNVESGEVEAFEAGNYYAVVGGEEADEIVGVVVVEGAERDRDDITFQETGSFIVTDEGG